MWLIYVKVVFKTIQTVMSDRKPSKRYPCTYKGCKSSFPRPSKLANHIQRHEGKKPYPCDVEGCDKGYTTQSHLKRHKSIQHEKATTKTVCTVADCKKAFSTLGNMQRHIKKAHNPNRTYNYICKECKQSFPKKRILNQHMYLHTGEFYCKCTECEEGFHLLSELDKHRRLHMVYPCGECNKKFKTWSSLRKHKMLHRPLFKCKQCQYKTYRTVLLNAHEATHMPTEKRKQFACPYDNCKRSYLYFRNLNKHMNTFHKGIKGQKIVCTIHGCAAKLSRMQCLKNHVQLIHQKSPATMKRSRYLRKDAGKAKTSEISRLIVGSVQSATQVNGILLDKVSQVLNVL